MFHDCNECIEISLYLLYKQINILILEFLIFLVLVADPLI